MTTLDFRIDWGYQFVYSRRHYHPEYCWDGELSCIGGRIESVFQLDYPYTWWGPVHSARETELPGRSWRSTTRRGLAGVRVIANCDTAACFVLRTVQGTFTFSAADILQQGRLVFPVGHKYSHCTVIVTRTGFLWYRPVPRLGEIVIEAEEMLAKDPDGADLVSFSRMQQRWIRAGSEVDMRVQVPKVESTGETAWLLHLQAMTAVTAGDPYQLARDYMPMEITCDSQPALKLRPLFRFHDMAEQILHDVWGEIDGELLAGGDHVLALRNRHESLPLLVHRVTLRPLVREHLQAEGPRWVRCGRVFIIRVRALHDCVISINVDEKQLRALDADIPRRCGRGLHEFRFEPLTAAVNVQVTFSDGSRFTTVSIPAVYEMSSEAPEVQVGYDMTTVPHDDTGTMDWLLDYTHRTQLGNLICFRPFPKGFVVEPRLLERWGHYCREHAITMQCINLNPGPLVPSGNEYFDAAGDHELSWATYLCDPENVCTNMQEAAEAYVAFVRSRVNELRKSTPRVAFGDGSGGHRYSLIAGADFLRAETMVANTMHHLSQARAAATTLGTGKWGVHIAIQHPKQPYLESHLSQYALSLYQAWMMGARFLYEEDSLFVMFKEERQCWDDRLTKGKRDLTREFYRFACTHPRPFNDTWRGPELRIAHVLGRHAAPFHGFICGCEQDPAYSVWGQFGRAETAWGHLQPEKSQQLLDVLMPGASTHPLRQRYDRRRFFFSGTPFGDFDQVPIEASAEQLARYKLLLLPGWHTMGEEDYEKLKSAVGQGSTLLLGVPQLSTHVGREFLGDMDDLALFRSGDVSDLTGVRVVGRGARYCGHWAHTGPEFQRAACPPLSRVPSVSPDEDGPCYLAEVELEGATPVIVDAISGKPLLVHHQLGRGDVYLITTHAYVGHEEMSDFAGAVISHLCERSLGEYRVSDSSREVFWTFWPGTQEGTGQLMLLNTDWTEPRNGKRVAVHTPPVQFEVEVLEGVPLVITSLPFCTLVPLDHQTHVEIRNAGPESADVRIHGIGPQRLRVFANESLLVEQAELEGQCLSCTPIGTFADLRIRRHRT